MAKDDSLSPEEAAELLGVSKDSIRRAFDRGEIDGHRTSTDERAWRRLKRESVEAYGRKLRGESGQADPSTA